MAGGKYGCTWKVISGKFQLAQNNKMTFIVDSDTEKAANDEEEEEEEEEVDVTKDLSDVKIANSDDEAEADVTEDAKEEPKVATTAAARGRKGAAAKK